MITPQKWLPHLLAIDDRYLLARALFLRLLALIYLAAFVSTAIEIQGLVGRDGILPADAYLDGLERAVGPLAWIRFPTLFWIDVSDTTLLLTCYAGILFSLILLIGRLQTVALIVLFLLYLSLFKVGQMFFNFQWEFLLLEAGFLAIFLVSGPSRLLLFLFHWLLFRLRFESGLSKLASGDPNWAGLTTLNHYFETQPLPHIGSWYVHQLPEWLLRTGTGATLLVELIVPFFIFLPRPFRLAAAIITILFQLLIILTSNHNFINLLTIALCLFLIDDQAWRRALPWLKGSSATVRQTPLMVAFALPLVAVLVVPTSIWSAWEYFAERPPVAWNHPANWVRGWGLGSVYHIFPNMQTQRHELTIQGSSDGINWSDYRFRYKPNAANEVPRFIVPLHPRLDWLIWFIPPQHAGMRPWFDGFMRGLARNSPAVTGLLAHNPFAGGSAPRYLRILVHRYRFTTPGERAATGNIWHSEYLGEFPRVPPRNP